MIFRFAVSVKTAGRLVGVSLSFDSLCDDDQDNSNWHGDPASAGLAIMRGAGAT
jgi:hypothetical protein